MPDLKFKVEWFGQQAERLEDAACSLEALAQCVDVISYAPEYEIAMLRPEYWDWRDEVLRGTASLAEGAANYRQVAAAIRSTGRAYAVTEARATDMAGDVERWLQDAGL